MTKRITLLFLIIINLNAFSQTDHNGNPVFNSVVTDEKEYDGFRLTSSYYTLKNNIDNRHSSVYISDNPAPDQIEEAAVSLPSDFFILSKGQKVTFMILVNNSPAPSLFVIDIKNNTQQTYDLKLKGDISENRAREIVAAGYDPEARIEKGSLFFNNHKLSIQSNKKLNKQIGSFIRKHNLDQADESEIIIPSQQEIRTYILEQSAKGGKLDFFTAIEGSENDGIQIKPGIYSTKLGVALYHWGRANYDLGINTLEDVFDIFTDLRGREPTVREKEYIKMGFNNELE